MYTRKNQRFCHKCGGKLEELVAKIICPNCNRRTSAIARCNACGIIRSDRDMLIFQHFTRLNDRIDSIETKIEETVSIVRSLKSGTIHLDEVELDRIDISSQEEMPTPESEKIETTVMEETISQPEITASPEESKIFELETEAVDELPISVEEELIPRETFIEEEIPTIEEELIEGPSLPIPNLLPFKLKRRLHLEPISLPTRGRQTTSLVDIPLKIQLKEFIEGPLLTSIGIFSLILALLYFGETGTAGEEPDQLLKSITYTIGGIFIIVLGYLMIEDKFPLIKGSQYYLGTLFVITGFLLGITQNIATIIEDDPLPILFISLLIIITAWIGYKNESIMTLSLVTIIGLLVPQILSNSKFEWSILLFGGGLLWMIPFAIFATTIGLKEKSYVHAFFMLAK